MNEIKGPGVSRPERQPVAGHPMYGRDSDKYHLFTLAGRLFLMQHGRALNPSWPVDEAARMLETWPLLLTALKAVYADPAAVLAPTVRAAVSEALKEACG